jgi:aerobic-type carbon monoxide dehydrogenase small subunit (CoxS/CutS family)
MIQLGVNGTEQSFDGDPEMPLLWYLRDVLELTGTKFGCCGNQSQTPRTIGRLAISSAGIN